MWLNRPLDAISSEHERHLVGQACCARDCDLSHTRYILRGFARIRHLMRRKFLYRARPPRVACPHTCPKQMRPSLSTFH
jgi:hypothetical protein